MKKGKVLVLIMGLFLVLFLIGMNQVYGITWDDYMDDYMDMAQFNYEGEISQGADQGKNDYYTYFSQAFEKFKSLDHYNDPTALEERIQKDYFNSFLALSNAASTTSSEMPSDYSEEYKKNFAKLSSDILNARKAFNQKVGRKPSAVHWDDVADEPSNTTEKPSNTTEKPNNTTEKPNNTTEKPSEESPSLGEYMVNAEVPDESDADAIKKAVQEFLNAKPTRNDTTQSFSQYVLQGDKLKEIIDKSNVLTKNEKKELKEKITEVQESKEIKEGEGKFYETNGSKNQSTQSGTMSEEELAKDDKNFLENIFGEGGSFFQKGKNQASKNEKDIGTYLVTFLEDTGTVIVKRIGMIIFACITIVLGIKYVWSGVEGKTEVKETLPTFVVGVIFFFLATQLYNFFNTGFTDIFLMENVQYADIEGGLYKTLMIVANVAALAGIIAVGLKYMLTSAEGKADVKKRLLPVVIGIIFVYCSLQILQLVINAGSQIITGTDKTEVFTDIAGTPMKGVEEITSNVWGVFTTLVQFISITIIIITGLRYMLASADLKANIKKQTLILIMGSILVFCAIPIARFIESVSEKELSKLNNSNITVSGGSNNSQVPRPGGGDNIALI